MSTCVGIIEGAGSREEDIDVTRYWGGARKGMCYQLTSVMEGDACKMGYVQLNYCEVLQLLQIVQNDTELKDDD